MPELPEVETTLKGIKPSVFQQEITNVIVRHPRLRWPIPANLKQLLRGQRVNDLTRRGKYLLFQLDSGMLILHLGMSGRVQILTTPKSPLPHDHVDICFSNQRILRFTDPRRFGALLYTTDDPHQHPLLANIGPEPLTTAFDAQYLFNLARGKKVPVKSYIMNGNVVAGVGNIYASEALFEASIHPLTPAGAVTLAQYKRLVTAIKAILKAAIKQGGTTLKDFMQSDGKPGYFSIKLNVYGRQGQACPRCRRTLLELRIGQRSTVYCQRCQP